MPSATDLFIDDSIFVFDELPNELYYFAYGSNMNSYQHPWRKAPQQTMKVLRF